VDGGEVGGGSGVELTAFGRELFGGIMVGFVGTGRERYIGGCESFGEDSDFRAYNVRWFGCLLLGSTRSYCFWQAAYEKHVERALCPVSILTMCARAC